MKRFVAFVLALLLLCVPVFADGDEFEELNIFVDILENGDALITEEWNVVNGEYGTEWYKPMTNMNHMDIKDFKVLFNGEPGEDMGKDWDTDLNFKKKAYKFGINKIGFKQYELCFGKSQRGPMKYTMSYTLTNFVEKFKPDPNDKSNYKSGFIVKLVNDSMDPAPDRVNIKIKHESVEFNKKNTGIWAYGTDKGYIEFLDIKDGNGIYSSENTSIISNSPGVVAFEADMFDGGDQVIIMLATKADLDGYKSRKTFTEMRDRAHEGSDYIERANMIYRFIMSLIALVIFMFIVVYIPFRIEKRMKRLDKN